MTYIDMKFGIEMEFTFVTRRRAAKSLAEVFGTRDEYIGAGYDTYGAADTAGRVWKIQRDSSIVAQEMRGGAPVGASANYQCELVTPVLTFADMPLLQKVIRKLRADGAKSNDSCGFHVHLSAPEEFSTRSLINLINMVHSKQTLMYEALGVIPSRMRYADYLPDTLCDEIKRARPKTNEKLARVWYSALGGYSGTGHYNSSRYHCLYVQQVFM